MGAMLPPKTQEMTVLFVTRKYPPSEGGMETAAYELHRELAALHDVHLIKWAGTNRWLPFIYPLMVLRALVHSWLARPDVVYLQDGALAPLGLVLQLLARRRTVMTIHGLDVTYPNPIYQRLVIPMIARQSELVAVSRATQQLVVAATGRTDVRLVNNGARAPGRTGAPHRDLKELLGEDVEIDRPLIYMTGRLVPRKGIVWFLSEVMPLLSADIPDILCVVSGTGPDADEVAALANSPELRNHVRYLGRVGAESRDLLYNCASLFVMPNRPQPGDIEGFGLVATEAASCGTPVIAAATGGITDAVIDGENGYLLPPGEAAAFVATIAREIDAPTLDRDRVSAFTLDRFSWKRAAELYADVFAGAEFLGVSG